MKCIPFLLAQNALRKSYRKRLAVKRRGFNILGNHTTEICQRCERTKKREFEPADYLHKNWLNYSSKHDINKDIEPLYPLLTDPSSVTHTPTQILDALYNTTLVILESTPQLDNEQKTRALYLSYNLCTCNACQKECGAHINKKGQIRISQKLFQNKIHSPPPTGHLELMYTILHQMLHGIFPELDEETITEKNEQVWKTGIAELAKEKLSINSQKD